MSRRQNPYAMIAHDYRKITATWGGDYVRDVIIEIGDEQIEIHPDEARILIRELRAAISESDAACDRLHRRAEELREAKRAERRAEKHAARRAAKRVAKRKVQTEIPTALTSATRLTKRGAA